MQEAGINILMRDLALANEKPNEYYHFGGGNPSHIKKVTSWLIQQLKTKIEVIDSNKELVNSLIQYAHPSGNEALKLALTKFFNKKLSVSNSQKQFQFTKNNFVITAGSQQLFYILFQYCQSQNKAVYFVRTPEYIGYSDLISKKLIITEPALVTAVTDNNKFQDFQFKYRINLAAVEERLERHSKRQTTPKIGCMCISMPSNPSGNIPSIKEQKILVNLAHKYKIPLILDHAYGGYFPNINYGNKFELFYNDYVINSFSFSKLGLPGLRQSYALASEQIVNLVTDWQSVLSLAPPNFNSAILTPILENYSQLEQLIIKDIQPFYKEKISLAQQILAKELSATKARWHQPQGGFFLWLNLPFKKFDSNMEIYHKLLDKNIITVPGDYFMHSSQSSKMALDNNFLRIGLTQANSRITEGLEKLAKIICP